MRIPRILSVLSIAVFTIQVPLFAATSQPNSVSESLAKLETSFRDKIGASAIDTNNHGVIQYNADQRFPMGCTSKVMGVAAILKKSMINPAYLQEKISYTQRDLLDWAPITTQHVSEGMTIEQLCAAAISYSDNTAMNLLVKQIGGLKGVNAYAKSIGDNSFKLNHWWPDEAYGNLFNGTDSSTPAAMAASLQKLVLGNALAPTQRDLLKTWMIENTTGDARIRAGVPSGWIVGDKTGTGFNYGTANDIAVIWPPHCAPIVIALFTTSTQEDAPAHDDAIAAATSIIIKGFAQTDPCIKGALSQTSDSKLQHVNA